MTFEQQWLEYDYNPFILFSSNGKIISLNTEAQFLLSNAVTSELFKLATTYASLTFGFKTTFLELEFGKYKFYGITVGYESDDVIGIKLYQAPKFKLNNPKPEGELVNIYTLVDLCISTNSINSPIKFLKDFDPTIPSIIINSNTFLKLLNRVYGCFTENTTVKTKIYCRVGEHIKFEENKFGIFSIEVSADNMDKRKASELETLTEKSGFYLNIQDSITINIPMITA